MEVQILNTISDYRVLNKTYTTIATAQSEPFGELDIDTPVIRIKPFTGFASANAFYIPEFLRYYIITKVKRISGNIIEIYGKVDVLSTFKDVIKQCKGVCVANEKLGSSHITDPNYPVDLRKNTTVYEFEGDPFNVETASDASYNFILNVAGGGQIEPS